jgi:hypothetical protein
VSGEEIVRAVIRGEKPLSALKAVGLNVRSEVAWSVRPDLSDIGAGVCFYSTRRGAKRWAELLLHAAYIDLQPAPDSPDWDALMGAIWDLSSGLPVSDHAAAVALRVSQPANRLDSR